jgi:glycosyltransferase involved in cell wall biosynthesis
VLVWDAERPPDAVPPCAAPLRHLARPLDGDFAAQRNAALDACHAPWVLFLDGDEQLPAPVWEALPALCGREEQGWWLPRLTLEGPAAPGGERVLIGHGLWPDLQLRLFRNRPGPRFQRPVHERLVGLEGPVGLLQNAQILHLSRVRKDPQALAEKLALFDRAAQGRVRHRLNSEYPALPLDAFEAEPGDALRALVLARNPA